MASKFKGIFTKHEVDTAIKVLLESDYVKNWVTGELRAYGVDPTSAEGVKFTSRRSVEIAKKLIT